MFCVSNSSRHTIDHESPRGRSSIAATGAVALSMANGYVLFCQWLLEKMIPLFYRPQPSSGQAVFYSLTSLSPSSRKTPATPKFPHLVLRFHYFQVVFEKTKIISVDAIRLLFDSCSK